MRSRLVRTAIAATAVMAAAGIACTQGVDPMEPMGPLTLGNWGGVDAGMIVSDTAMHVHIGCTFGDVSGRVQVDFNGMFDVRGRYTLRAYPVAVGPSLPARFAGRRTGDIVTLTVTVDDTVAHETVVKGPVVVILGRPSQLGPCPICRRPVVTQAVAAHH